MVVGVEEPSACDESLVIPPSGRVARWLYAVSIPGVCVLLGVQAAALVGQTRLEAWPLAVLAFFAGAAGADLVTGVVHWACDSYGSSKTRWVGAGLIHAFRVHHRRPRAMLAHDTLDVNGGACAAIFGLLGVWTAATVAGAVTPPGLRAFGLGFAAVAAGANQLHAWAHRLRPPPWVRLGQRFGVLLSRTEHARHHRAPHTCGYCIALGWLNRPLDALGFWRGLERAVEFGFGVTPRSEPTAVAPAHCEPPRVGPLRQTGPDAGFDAIP